jgi:hypothetical protein
MLRALRRRELTNQESRASMSIASMACQGVYGVRNQRVDLSTAATGSTPCFPNCAAEPHPASPQSGS